jgi:predicted PurR-regulated permease PerM
MEFSREKIKQIRNLMLFAALLVLFLLYSKDMISALCFLVEILKPFIYGAIIAFILNIPMSGLEKGLFQKRNGKCAGKLKRPVCMLLSILLILLIVSIIVVIVIPQLTSSISEIGKKIPIFMEHMQEKLDYVTENNPFLAEQLGEFKIAEIQWDSVIEKVTNFLTNGAVGMLSSTFTMVGSIISSVVDGIVSFVFALYILAQKEKLQSQAQRILTAYFPGKIVKKVRKVCGLLYENFRNFITGQCLEAVILGTMFVVSMSILRLPYAVVIGILIGMTAIIPIVGAFIGCVVGIFLILIENPVQAVIFLILFFVLQQIEGKLIYPKVVGNFVGLPGIWVLFAVTIGGSLFGILGMFAFVPLVSTGYSLLRDDVNRRNELRDA